MDLSWLDLIITALPLVIHSLGLFLLFKTHRIFRDVSQLYFLVNLSISEALFVLLGVLKELVHNNKNDRVYFCLFAVQYMNVSVQVILAMIYMTFDRFFEVFFNITYPLYWNGIKTRNLLLFTWMFNALLVLPVVFHQELDPVLLNTFCYLYLFPIIELFFLLQSVFVYTYILYKLKKNRVAALTVKEKLRRNRRSTRHFFVPFIIVCSFTLFIVVPDLVIMYFIATATPVSVGLSKYISWSYMLNLFLDAFSYILLTPVIRGYLKNICRCTNRSVLETRVFSQ